MLEQQAAQAEERAISATAESLIKTYPDLDHTKPGANLEAIATVQALSAMYVNRDLLALRRWWTLLIGWPSSMGWERRRKLTFRMKPRWRRRKKLSHRPAQRQRCRQAFRQFLRHNPPADELQALSSMSVQQVQDKLMTCREKNTGRSVSTVWLRPFDSPP